MPKKSLFPYLSEALKSKKKIEPKKRSKSFIATYARSYISPEMSQKRVQSFSQLMSSKDKRPEYE